jgi:hypothetical protein
MLILVRALSLNLLLRKIAMNKALLIGINTLKLQYAIRDVELLSDAFLRYGYEVHVCVSDTEKRATQDIDSLKQTLKSHGCDIDKYLYIGCYYGRANIEGKITSFVDNCNRKILLLFTFLDMVNTAW